MTLFWTILIKRYIIVEFFEFKQEFVLFEDLRVTDFDEFHIVESFGAEFT